MPGNRDATSLTGSSYVKNVFIGKTEWASIIRI